VNTPLGLRYAARTDAGSGRTSNEDTAYAGESLLAVADGMRGAAGDRASAAAIAALRDVRAAPGELLSALADAVQSAQRAVSEIAADDPAGHAVTTLTAMLWSGSQLALAHIGDTRAYLLRCGGLFGVSSDDRMRSVLSSKDDSTRTVDALIELAYAGGAPDNIACVVADVVTA
jgi:PPM family protein phosphatase